MNLSTVKWAQWDKTHFALFYVPQKVWCSSVWPSPRGRSWRRHCASCSHWTSQYLYIICQKFVCASVCASLILAKQAGTGRRARTDGRTDGRTPGCFTVERCQHRRRGFGGAVRRTRFGSIRQKTAGRKSVWCRCRKCEPKSLCIVILVVNYLAPVGVPSIAMNLSVCLSVRVWRKCYMLCTSGFWTMLCLFAC